MTKRLPGWYNILERLQLKKQKIPRDVRNRWNSTFRMLNFTTEYARAIDALTGDCVMDLRWYELLREEVRVMKELKDVLHVSHL